MTDSEVKRNSVPSSRDMVEGVGVEVVLWTCVGEGGACGECVGIVCARKILGERPGG